MAKQPIRCCEIHTTDLADRACDDDLFTFISKQSHENQWLFLIKNVQKCLFFDKIAHALKGLVIAMRWHHFITAGADLRLPQPPVEVSSENLVLLNFLIYGIQHGLIVVFQAFVHIIGFDPNFVHFLQFAQFA